MELPFRYHYYLKSEPIRSALMAVVGLKDVIQSLKTFFDHFRETFVFNENRCELRLKVIFETYHK